MKKFKLKTLCWNAGIKKEQGFSSIEILSLLILMPLMTLKSVHSLYQSAYKETTQMHKDTIYRFMNSEKYSWRKLLYAVAKKYKELVNPKNEIVENSAFIIDDTTDQRVGYKMENVTRIFDHTVRKTVYGFKHLVLAYFDGKTTTPIDYATHTEKKLDSKHRKKQFNKEVTKNSNGAKRRKETTTSKIDNTIVMVKRAVKNGFLPKYVLVDSWFTSLNFIQEIRSIKNGAMHIIAGIRNDRRKYTHNGELFNANQIIKNLKQTSKEKRNRSMNIRYFDAVVHYEGVGDVNLVICRYPFQKKYRVFISTDTTLAFTEMMKIYGIRWTIEVMFKELKQHLNLGKCQSRDFDAQIASVTISLILYTLLSYVKRMESYETMGELFRIIGHDMQEKTLAERLWQLFEELLTLVIDVIAVKGAIDIATLKQTEEYCFIKDLFASSFLANQLDSFYKSA